MKRTKALRRRCDLTACGKLYRYSDPRSRTCSSSCRQRLYLERKKAAAQVAQEQVEAERHEQAQARAARMQADRWIPALASPRLHHAPPRPHLHPLRVGTPTYGRWSPRPRWWQSVTASRTRPRSRDTLNNPEARLNFLCVELQGIVISYGFGLYCQLFPHWLPQFR